MRPRYQLEIEAACKEKMKSTLRKRYQGSVEVSPYLSLFGLL